MSEYVRVCVRAYVCVCGLQEQSASVPPEGRPQATSAIENPTRAAPSDMGKPCSNKETGAFTKLDLFSL